MAYKEPWYTTGWFCVVVLVLFLMSVLTMGLLIGVAVDKASKELKMPTIKVEVVQPTELTPPVVELGPATDGGKVE